VSTASTKRARKKERHLRSMPDRGRAAAADVPAPVPDAPAATDLSRRARLILSIAVLAVAALLRLYALDLKPMHHDEGVNGFFLEKLVRAFDYRYDPTNYHGPTLYFLTLPVNLVWGTAASVWAGSLSWDAVVRSGLDDRALRLLTALFGIGTVALVLTLRRYLGAVGALAAAALVAVSPGAVYYSRYFIHETLFVFFTLGVVVAALRFYETGRAAELWLAAVSAALLFATKETAFISAATLVLAALVAWGWARVKGGWIRPGDVAGSGLNRPTGRRGARGAVPAEGFAAVRARFGDGERALFLVGTSTAVFVFVAALFYSSFLTNPNGVSDAVTALQVWKNTGASDFHAKPIYMYVNWLWQEEAPILILGATGAAVALFGRRRNLFAVFAGAWGFGLLLAYSLIPYKTPWLALNFVVPLAVVGGYGVEALSRLRPWKAGLIVLTAGAGGYFVQRLDGQAAAGQSAALLEALSVGPVAGYTAAAVLLVAALTALALYLFLSAEKHAQGARVNYLSAAVLAGVAVCACGYQALVLNFRHYDDDRYPYVYSHTQREAVELVRAIERAAERAGTEQPAVSIASPDYWPLPWYFRGNSHVAYDGRTQFFYDPKTTFAIVGKEDQLSQLQAVTAGSYVRVGKTFPLRPGVRLVLFVRGDLAGG
jgi:uncharacterized protein (TIGR03663 family)